MTIEKPKPKQLLRPITTETNSSMNQSQFLVITCNSPEAREKSREHGKIGFGFASLWLKKWRESFKPITKRSDHNHVITFDSENCSMHENISRWLSRGNARVSTQSGKNCAIKGVRLILIGPDQTLLFISQS